jgi:hypothetical protein
MIFKPNKSQWTISKQSIQFIYTVFPCVPLDFRFIVGTLHVFPRPLILTANAVLLVWDVSSFIKTESIQQQRKQAWESQQ